MKKVFVVASLLFFETNVSSMYFNENGDCVIRALHSQEPIVLLVVGLAIQALHRAACDKVSSPFDIPLKVDQAMDFVVPVVAVSCALNRDNGKFKGQSVALTALVGGHLGFKLWSKYNRYKQIEEMAKRAQIGS